MKRNSRNAILLIMCLVLGTGYALARTGEGFILPGEGPVATTEMRDADGKPVATYSVTIRDKKGSADNGSQTMVYRCFKPDGKPYFKEPNEFCMRVSRKDGKTFTEMDEMTRAMKVQNLLPVGDVSCIPVDLSVGQTLPNSTIDVVMGKIHAELTITDKKVLDHRTITTPAGTFDCWQVHEKVTTKAPFYTSVAIADTWYALNVGCVSQTITDEDGRIVARQQLISLKP